MCLTINSYYHKSSDNCYGKGMIKYQPLKCDKDILVYKVLRVIEPYTDFEYRIRFNSGRYSMIQPSEPIYQTPFNYATIIFNEDGAARQSVDRFMTTADGFSNVIGYGIHSFYSKDYAIGVAKNFESSVSCGDYKRKVFVAIIPKNTEFFIGCDGDIVSKELKIYNHGHEDWLENQDFITFDDYLGTIFDDRKEK